MVNDRGRHDQLPATPGPRLLTLLFERLIAIIGVPQLLTAGQAVNLPPFWS